MAGYWQTDLPEAMKAAILADWADTLEDWTPDNVRHALRKWRDANPNKRPNPSHISNLLKSIRGKKEVERAKARQAAQPPEPRNVAQSPEEVEERRQQAERILSEFGFQLRVNK